MVQLIVYSDYLCPWCFNAAVRMERLGAEFGDALQVTWRSYLLRPRPSPGRSLEKFRAYTESWMRPAAEPDSGTFRVWQGTEGPPSHSIPPHQMAKAAARLGDEAFRRTHRRLLSAYFAENRDVSDVDVLRGLWQELELPAKEFDHLDDPELLREILAQHQEALESGVTGVPAVRMQGNAAVIVGAQPLELYARWVRRALDGKI